MMTNTLVALILTGFMLVFLSCENSMIINFEIKNEETANFIKEFGETRKTKLILLKMSNNEQSTNFELYDLYSTCILNTGDQFGFLVDEKWTNITAPLFKSRIDDIEIYVETGFEKLIKSRDRYSQLLDELTDRIDLCVKSYNEKEDEFIASAPQTTLQLPWKIEINEDATFMTTYRSIREGFDDMDYEQNTIRIDTNYREKYK